MIGPQRLALRAWYVPDPRRKPLKGWRRKIVPSLVTAVELVDEFQAFADELLARGVRDAATWGVERFEPDGFGAWDWFEVDQHELNEVRAAMDSLAA